MAERKRKIGIKAIKKALSDCALDPEKSIWYKIVAEADDNYLLRRTDELLREAIESRGSGAAYKTKLEQAIALLGLAKARNDEALTNIE